MFKKSKEECKCKSQKLVTVSDYGIKMTLSGRNGEEVIINSAQSGKISKAEAAISASYDVYSSRGYLLKNGTSEFLHPEYYTISKTVVTLLSSRQVLEDV
jgi:hypothetical protein